MVLITERIKDLDKQVIKFASNFKPRINPINITSIQERIAQNENKKRISKTINFDYSQEHINYDEALSQAKEISLKNTKIDELYKDKIEESKLKLKMLQSLGTSDFSKRSQKIYGLPTKALINKAFSILELDQSSPGNKISIQRSKEILKHLLNILNLDWEIQTKNMLSYALVQPMKQTVILKSNHKFSEGSIKRLAIHEIGTHGVRYMNARAQPLRIFKNFPGYISTEEGLAAFNEEITGHLNNNTLRRYAGRVVAIDYAKNHDLFETYDFLKKYFNRQEALNIALRVKRGLKSTRSHGAYTKDHVYLKGFFDIKEYVKKNPMKFLYYGKVGINYVPLIKKIESELTPIKYFPPIIKNYEKKTRIFGA